MHTTRPLQHLVICLLTASAVNFAAAHTFSDTGLLGEQLQVKLEPKYSSGNLIGIDVYELWIDEEVGHAFLSRRSYYRYDTKTVTEDREWYYLNGYIGEGSFEIENRYETQNWSITPELAAGLDRAARLVTNPKATTDELRKMYQSLIRGAFTVKAGEKEREGMKQAKWLPGLQRVGQAELILSKSPKYGNRFVAKFVN